MPPISYSSRSPFVELNEDYSAGRNLTIPRLLVAGLVRLAGELCCGYLSATRHLDTLQLYTTRTVIIHAQKRRKRKTLTMNNINKTCFKKRFCVAGTPKYLDTNERLCTYFQRRKAVLLDASFGFFVDEQY